jgi:hypothetical protein
VVGALSGDRDDSLSDFGGESLVLGAAGFCKASGSRNAARAGGGCFSDKRRKIASVRRIGRVETVGVSHGADGTCEPLICVVDDDDEVRSSLDSLLRSAGYRVRDYEGPAAYLADEARMRPIA